MTRVSESRRIAGEAAITSSIGFCLRCRDKFAEPVRQVGVFCHRETVTRKEISNA